MTEGFQSKFILAVLLLHQGSEVFRGGGDAPDLGSATITSERVRSRAVLRALKLYRRLRCPKERQRRREKRTGSKLVKKAGTTPKLTAAAATVNRHIPARVRDRVTIEGNNRCCFVAKNGIRCEETFGLQVDHVKPYSIGGGHEPENLRILCGAYNRLLYEQRQTS